MSIVSSIRDYVEFLNTLSDSLGNQLTSGKFITETCFYILKTLPYSVYYIITLQWLRDFTLLPVTIPQISHAIFSESFFLETPSKNFFEFLEIPSIDQNKFILGFFNSFFLTLPITVTHLIALRRLIIQGIPAALVSILGFILGQTLFILCVTFGLRGILIPWLSLEPFSYFLGIFLIFKIVYEMVGESLTPLNWNLEAHKKIFQKFFLLNFVLSWCEQSCIFQYFSNITLTSQSSILEGFSTKTTLANFFSHSSYIFGIFLGSILFSLFWLFFVVQIKNLIVNFTGISLTGFVQTVNRGSFLVILGFTLSSIPFYGIDYLFTSPLGFLSQDNVFKNTILDQNQIKDPLSAEKNADLSPFLNFDVSPFDRGRYLIFPEDGDLYSFEDLNYRGETDWIQRLDKASNIADSRGQFLSQFFTKQKIKQKDTNLVNNASLDSSSLNVYDESNSFLAEKDLYLIDDLSEIDSRFNNWYNFNSSEDSELSQDSLTIKNFKDFNLYSFSTDFFRKESTLDYDLEKKIKQKYYSNPIYKNLLTLDIDLFLNRQSNSMFLGAQNEIDLYEKRQLLNSYYDSLRLYTKLPYFSNFEDFFVGTKSFSNKIYNQQFKGTLRSIRRLFSLSQTSTDTIFQKNNSLTTVLKYDQPLYENNFKFSPYHEEIPEIEFFDKNRKNENQLANVFLNDFVSKPVYAGWDENLRKFVITNKLLPRSSAGYEINIPLEWYNKFVFEKQRLEKQKSSPNTRTSSDKIIFSIWPKQRNFFDKDQGEIPFITLFDTKLDPTLDPELLKLYKSFPSNYQNVLRMQAAQDESKKSQQGSDTSDTIISNLLPKRGGFIWPGNFPFDAKNLLK
jgi:hypothetical protein